MAGEGKSTSANAPKTARRTNKERRETTRARLLEATVQCLYEHGYAATTTARVVERAGFTRGAVLHHYATRVDLMLATALYIIEEQNRFRATKRSAAEDPMTRFLETIDVVWASWSRPHAMALVEIMIGQRSDPELAARYPAINQQIETYQAARFWDLAEKAGVKDREAVDDLLVFSVSAMRGLAIERLFTSNPARIERAFQLLKEARQMKIDQLLEAARRG